MIRPDLFIARRLVRRIRAKAKEAQTAKDWTAALKLWRRLSAVSPDAPHPHMQAGNMLVELARFDEARHEFSLAIAKGAGAAGLFGLAGVETRRADWPAALGAWQSALEAATQEDDHNMARRLLAEALAQTSACYLLLGDHARAERDLSFAIALSPPLRRTPHASVLRVRLDADARPEQKVRILARAHRTNADDHAVLFEYIRALEQAGDRAKAVALSRHLPPDAPSTRELIETLHLGKA